MLLAAGLHYEMKDFSETTGVRYWIDKTYQRIRRIEVQSGRCQPFPPEWKVYKRELMTMASLLRDDQRVMVIYQSLGSLCRGSAHHHLAGIAAFNLHQYNKARISWKKMHQLDGKEEGLLYAKIAVLTEKGVIPPFTVDYLRESAYVHLRHQHMEEMEEPVAGGAKQQALKQVANEQLEELFHFVHEGVGWMSLLILQTDEWGVQLGRNLLKETDIPVVLKSEIEELLEEAAQEALVSNVMDGKQPIQIYGDSYELVVEDQRADAAYDQGQVLRDKGSPDAAKDHILRMLGKQKAITPNVILLLSALEKAMGQAEQAMVLLEELDAVLPGNMAILYNKVTAMMQLRKWQEVWSC